MSRTHHTRPRRARTDPHVSAKKPDEGRRWHRRNVEAYTVAPRDARRAPLEGELEDGQP